MASSSIDGSGRQSQTARMALTQIPRRTVEDYLLLPDDGPRYQLIDGELYMAPSPNSFHQDISRNLVMILGPFIARRKLGKLYHAPFDVYLSEHNVFQPDVLFISNARAEILTKAGVKGAPDFVVEILSPSTARLDLDLKRRAYARFGVEELWIIDPKAREIGVYRFAENVEEPVATFREGDLIETRIFPGLKIDAREVFEE
jgi:Uma2 family endonuclease